MKPIYLALFLIASVSLSAQAEIVTQEIAYESRGVPLTGYLAYDSETKARRPAILVVHEWWGHNAYARKRAEMLAGLGYVGFALDMYGEGKVTDHPDDAKKFMQQALSDQKVLFDRFQAALEFIKQHEMVDDNYIVAIGYCFGGGVVLNMARAGVNIRGVVSFHGSLATKTPAQKDQVTAKVVVFHGANDAFISMEQVAAFEQEMKAANVDYDLVVYEAAEHSFTNPAADEIAEQHSMPVSYDEQADQNSWEQMQEFFLEMFLREPKSNTAESDRDKKSW